MSAGCQINLSQAQLKGRGGAVCAHDISYHQPKVLGLLLDTPSEPRRDPDPNKLPQDKIQVAVEVFQISKRIDLLYF